MESDSTGKGSGLESSIKPGEMFMNTKRMLIDKDCENRTYNQVTSGQVYISLKLS